MSNLDTSTPVQAKTKREDHEPNLKGTLVSVILLGLILIGIWAGVFALYMARL